MLRESRVVLRLIPAPGYQSRGNRGQELGKLGTGALAGLFTGDHRADLDVHEG